MQQAIAVNASRDGRIVFSFCGTPSTNKKAGTAGFLTDTFAFRLPTWLLQRSHHHLPELDDAGAGVELQRDPAVVRFGVVGAGGDDAVHLDGNRRTLRVDLEDTPLVCRLVDRLRRRDVHQAASAVELVGILVPDLHLESARRGVHLLGIGRAQVNAAIGVVAGPDFRVDFQVLERLLRDQDAGALGRGLVRHDGTAFASPVGVAEAIEVFEAFFTVDQRDPARAGWLPRAAEYGQCDRQ